jgi:hypothetical protein
MLPRRFLFGATAAALGIFLAIAASELVVRIAGLDDFELELSMVANAPPAMRFDPKMGWRGLPGHAENNLQGFRHLRDYTPKKNLSGRISIVGDSQVYGLYVTKQRHLGVLLDRELPDVETYSFGLPGYGPAQESLLVAEVLETYETDALVIVPFLQNDTIDATLEMAYGHMQKPYFEQGSEGWKVVNMPVPRPALTETFFASSKVAHFLEPRPGLYETSALYRAVVNRSINLPLLSGFLSATGLAETSSMEATAWGGEMWSLRRVDGLELGCWSLSSCPEDHWQDGLPAMVAAYVEMANKCKEFEVSFAVLLTPSLAELELGRFPMATALGDRLRDRGIEVIDLTPTFSGFKDWRSLTRPAPDYHWAPLGHRVAMYAIIEYWSKLKRNSGDKSH